MRSAIRDPAQLCRLLGLPQELEAAARRAAESFPVFVPLGYLARIQPGDPHDPLLRQVLPLVDELDTPAGYSADPVGDGPATAVPGLLWKYEARVLMVTTGACPVHCRYCFRRHFPYDDLPSSRDPWKPALDYIAADPSITEVLLSGGDPLTRTDPQLAGLAARLGQIKHLRRLRIHTRMPIMIPERVNSDLLAWLGNSRLARIVVVHVNHPAEIDPAVARALGRMVDAGIPVLNQSVLLRGVNDDLETLLELSQRLIDLRVMPYYLHQLDRVAGAAHFEVPAVRGVELIRAMRARLPGYAVPRYVTEEAGKENKTVLA